MVVSRAIYGGGWSFDETKALVGIWEDSDVQNQLVHEFQKINQSPFFMCTTCQSTALLQYYQFCRCFENSNQPQLCRASHYQSQPVDDSCHQSEQPEAA